MVNSKHAPIENPSLARSLIANLQHGHGGRTVEISEAPTEAGEEDPAEDDPAEEDPAEEDPAEENQGNGTKAARTAGTEAACRRARAQGAAA